MTLTYVHACFQFTWCVLELWRHDVISAACFFWPDFYSSVLELKSHLCLCEGVWMALSSLEICHKVII